MSRFKKAAFDAAARYVCDAEAVDPRTQKAFRAGKWRRLTERQWIEIVTLKQLILDTFGMLPEGAGAEALDRERLAPSLRRVTARDLLTMCGWTYGQAAH